MSASSRPAGEARRCLRGRRSPGLFLRGFVSAALWGLGLAPRASSGCPRRPLPSRLAGPGSAWSPSASPTTRAANPAATACRRQAAGVEPRGVPHPRLQGPTSSATPFLAPARREAGLSVPPCRVPIYPTSPRAREAWRMTGELALYRAAPVQHIVPSGGTLRQSCEGEAASPYVIDEGTEAEW